MRNIIALLIIICLLSGCGILTENERLKSDVADAKSESSHMVIEDSRDDTYEINRFEKLSSLTLLGEMSYQIQDDIPPFTFKAYCRDGKADFISDLQIVNTETNESFGDFCLIDYTFSWDVPKGIPDEFYELELIDVDFDGYKDIRVFGGYNGNWNKYYIYFIWDSVVGRFIDDPYGLADLGLPTFDEGNRLAHSMQRASAADHWYYTHKYIEGKLVTIEEISNNCVWDNWLDDLAKEQIKAIESLYEEGCTFMHFTKKQLTETTMELVIVEEKYLLFSEDAEIAEYALGSEIGLLLSSYER